MRRLLAIASLFALVSLPAHAQLLIDSYDPIGEGSSSRSAGDSPLARVTVSQLTSINQIAVRNDLASDGDIKFVIFNMDNNTAEYISSAKSFVDDGMSYKLSDVFGPIVLTPGVNYGIGGIADVAGGWSYSFPSTDSSANGVTVSGTINDNAGNFAAPIPEGPGGAKIHIQLYGSSSNSAVPEPGTLALLGLALPVFGLVQRRKV